MTELKKVLYDEIEGFRAKGHEYLNGEINLMQFKHASGGFGVYGQRGGKTFMIRLRLSSGVARLDQIKKVYELAKKYDVEKIHFTTRQAIQFHGLSIDNVCDLMKEALDNDIYTRGSGGNYPRNVAISPLSGVNKDEAFDVTPYALEVEKYFMERIYTYKLPRKLKVSFSSSNSDAAHCTVQDLGFIAVKKDGKNYFQGYLGGGLGQNPKLAVEYPELINPNEILYYIEAMVKFFMAEGDYENRNRARVRYILDRMGEEAFIECYKKYVEEAKAKKNMDIEVSFKNYNKPGIKIDIKSKRLFEQKQEGLYSVYLHPLGGQLKTTDLKSLIDAIEDVEDVELRLAMSEGIYIRNLNGNEAKEILDLTEPMSGKTLFEQSVSCIGIPICQVGICNSQGLLENIMSYFKEKKFEKDILPRVHISGCGNSCGVHQIGHIGFTGKKKRVNDKVSECFSLYLDGCFAVGETKLGKCYGDMLADTIPDFLYDLAIDIDNSGLTYKEYIEKNKNELENIINKYLV
ncbi:nitrite/sulfite reductase [Clostridium carnis]